MASKKEMQRLKKALEAINELLSEEERWGTLDYLPQVEKLLAALANLEAVQKPFTLVDRDLSLADKSARLMKWFGTHPDFKSAKLRVADDLPAEGGASRGVRADEDIAKGKAVFQIPSSTMLSVSSALRTTDLGLILLQPSLNIKSLPTVVLTLHLLAENAKCLAKDAAAKSGSSAAAAASLEVVPPAPNWIPTEVDPTFVEYAKSKGIDISSYLKKGDEHDEDNCKDTSHGHSHSHGHGHGTGSHGHSHNGKPCTGHGHGSAPPPAASHGHSHGGKPCAGHGHGASPEEPVVPLVPLELDFDSHPWGSHFRAYLSLLPEQPCSSLHFGAKEYRLLNGLALGYELARFLRNSVATYLKLNDAFGPQYRSDEAAGAPLLGSTFAEHFTWAGFKWAMSNVMSRQNRVPFHRGVDPLAEVDFTLAMIPLYDMVNSADPSKFILEGKKDKVLALAAITSFFLPSPSNPHAGGVLILEAPEDFKAGEEVTMSYGNRQCSQLLQFQGFFPRALRLAAEIAEKADRARYKELIERSDKELAEAAEKAGHKVKASSSSSSSSSVDDVPTKEQEEAALALLSQEYAIVEAAMDEDSAKKDDFCKIKRSLLQSLEIRPDANARKHLESFPASQRLNQAMQEVQLAVARSARANGGRPNLSAEERKALNDKVDNITWALPFAFQVYGNAEVSVDLVSYLRVAAIDNKPDAAKALRSVDGARQDLALKIKEARAKQDELTKKREEKMRAKAEALKAKHGGSASASATGAGADEDDDDDDDDDDDEDIPVSFQLAMSKLSDDNELETQANLLEVLDYAIEQVDKETLMRETEAAGSGSAGSAAANKEVMAYRDFQVGIMRRARVKALAKLEELSKAAEAAGAPAASVAGQVA